MEVGKGGYWFDWFFLAMAHWQLGHKEEARRWYDQGVAWMEKTKRNWQKTNPWTDRSGAIVRRPRTSWV